MIYSSEQMEEILNRFKLNLYKANQQGEIEKFLCLHDFEEYLFEDEYDDSYESNLRRAKIAIISYRIKNKNDISSFLYKKYGIPKDRVEFIDTENGFNINSIKYTSKFSDLIIGPVPHKLAGVCDNSIISEIENNKEMFPKTHRCIDSHGTLCLSKNSICNVVDELNFVKNCIY